jgi:hypothetical protein
MGIVEFGTDYVLTPDDYVEANVIGIHQEELSSSAITMYYYDLILIPADEYFGMYFATGWDWYERLLEGNYLDIDAIGNPRAPRSIMRRSIPSISKGTANIVISEWEHQSRGGPILQKSADQRLWFLFASRDDVLSEFYSKVIGKVYRVSRYLGMRGTN